MSEELEQKIKSLKTLVDEGAPAWVVTFGDLMSLLLCFFVLLLSFSELDKAKYKEVAGSLAKAFGVQRKTKAFQAPKGIKMIAKDFDQQIIATHEREEFIATQKRQELGRELKKEIDRQFGDMEGLVQVELKGDRVEIKLMGETAFDSGKAEIKKQMIPLLLKIGHGLKQTTGNIVVSGHTDNVPVKGGRYQSNLKLSMARAATVAEFLLKRSAIDPMRIATMGFGKYRPIESNETPEGRKRNRRVEIVLSAADPKELMR